jgi:hypothetical protein
MTSALGTKLLHDIITLVTMIYVQQSLELNPKKTIPTNVEGDP